MGLHAMPRSTELSTLGRRLHARGSTDPRHTGLQTHSPGSTPNVWVCKPMHVGLQTRSSGLQWGVLVYLVLRARQPPTTGVCSLVVLSSLLLAIALGVCFLVPGPSVLTWSQTLGVCSLNHAAPPKTELIIFSLANKKTTPSSCNLCNSML